MRKVDWVFGYGSLIWDPGFAPAESVRAWAAGFARSFCLRSIEHRGTRTRPGLVLGLDEQSDAECGGLALRIADSDHDEVLAYLRARELVTDAYQEAILPLRLEYVFNTAAHLAQIGLGDAVMDHLARQVRKLLETDRNCGT